MLICFEPHKAHEFTLGECSLYVPAAERRHVNRNYSKIGFELQSSDMLTIWCRSAGAFFNFLLTRGSSGAKKGGNRLIFK